MNMPTPEFQPAVGPEILAREPPSCLWLTLDYLAATLMVDGVDRSWKLARDHLEVVCNVQELAILKWLVEAYDAPS
jgi:hypothetical protein